MRMSITSKAGRKIADFLLIKERSAHFGLPKSQGDQPPALESVHLTFAGEHGTPIVTLHLTPEDLRKTIEALEKAQARTANAAAATIPRDDFPRAADE